MVLSLEVCFEFNLFYIIIYIRKQKIYYIGLGLGLAMGDVPPNLLFDGFGKGRVISGLEVVLRFP